MAEHSGGVDRTVDHSVTPSDETQYANRLHILAEEAGLKNIPQYRALIREFANNHLRPMMRETTPAEQLDTEYDLAIVQIQAMIDQNPDRVVDLLAAQINKLPITTPKTPGPIRSDNLLRLLVANHEKGRTGTYPWSHHQQLVGGFRGSSKDGFATADDRALHVNRLIMNQERPAPQRPPIRIAGS